MRMLDLFSGRGGASSAMRERRWDVLRVEIDPKFSPDIVADLNHWIPPQSMIGVDLLWASPPCTEFSRESMPWCRTGKAPSLELVLASMRIRDYVRPKYWVIENVRGSVKWLKPLLGPPMYISGPVYIWGRLPGLLLPIVKGYKSRQSGKRPDLRSLIPYEISLAIAKSIERSIGNEA